MVEGDPLLSGVVETCEVGCPLTGVLYAIFVRYKVVSANVIFHVVRVLFKLMRLSTCGASRANVTREHNLVCECIVPCRSANKV